jgi:O-antigen ligase
MSGRAAPLALGASARVRGPSERLLGGAAALAASALAGGLTAIQPKLGIGVVGAGVLLAVAFLAPVANVLCLVFITAIVPFGIQNELSIGGGQGAPGLLVTDVLLMAGLARAALELLEQPLRRRGIIAVWLLSAFLAVCAAQFVHGLRAGNDASEAGSELRVVLGFAVALITLPVLRNPAARDRLLRGLVFVGIALGLWGLAQWALDIPFATAGDAGVREGVRFTTAGRGQLQGGLYAFPVAAVLGLAALFSPVRRSLMVRTLLVVLVALNLTALLLTYERTFWIATLVGFAFVAMRSRRGRRMTALAAGVALTLGLIGAFAIVAPRELAAARERLQSVNQYGSDLSVRYRLLESRHVIDQIRSRPITGSGLGSALLWGRPHEGIRPAWESFVHNGYLWLGWKLGIPGALLLLLVIGTSVAVRAPPREDQMLTPVRVGAQAALLVLLLVNVTFSFTVLGITATMGLLIAICIAPWVIPQAVATPLRGPSRSVRRSSGCHGCQGVVAAGRPSPSRGRTGESWPATLRCDNEEG